MQGFDDNIIFGDFEWIRDCGITPFRNYITMQ